MARCSSLRYIAINTWPTLKSKPLKREDTLMLCRIKENKAAHHVTVLPSAHALDILRPFRRTQLLHLFRISSSCLRLAGRLVRSE